MRGTKLRLTVNNLLDDHAEQTVLSSAGRDRVEFWSASGSVAGRSIDLVAGADFDVHRNVRLRAAGGVSVKLKR